MYGCLLCLENPYAFLVQFVQSTGTDTPHYDRINLLTVHSHNRIAGPMLMVLITVADRCNIACLRIDNDKGWRRPKMIVDHTVHVLIFQHGKTYFHYLTPINLLCTYAHITLFSLSVSNNS
jgi:hypothetical protein